MRRTLFLAAVTFWCVAGVAAATVVEVPLPELTGQYLLYENYQRTAPFELLPIPGTVHGTSLRLVGTFTVRLSWCGFGTMEPFPQDFRFEASMPDPTTSGAWRLGASTTESGAFDRTIAFTAFSGASWGFLEGGTGQVTLAGYGCPVVDLCWPVTECSEAFVDHAYLLVDAEFPIAVNEATWGRIKALFETDR